MIVTIKQQLQKRKWATASVQGPCINAILNFSCQVDAVMEMFPHLTDAQKLAAEILRLKAQGEVF